MELVYLWVEKYKNIKNQCFNFSPRFRCEYDSDTNELTIKENDDYIENFFGENINITAIVGKNGSGKSSLIESLLNAFENIYKHKHPSANKVVYNGYILLFKYQNINYYFNGTNKRLIINSNILIKEFPKDSINILESIIHYDNSLNILFKETFLKNIIQRRYRAYNRITLLPNKEKNIREILNNEIQNLFFHILNNSKFIKNIFKVNNIVLYYSPNISFEEEKKVSFR